MTWYLAWHEGTTMLVQGQEPAEAMLGEIASWDAYGPADYSEVEPFSYVLTETAPEIQDEVRELADNLDGDEAAEAVARLPGSAVASWTVTCRFVEGELTATASRSSEEAV